MNILLILKSCPPVKKQVMKVLLDDLINTVWTDERVIEYGQLAKEHGFQFSKRERFSIQPYQLKEFELFKGKKGKRLSGILHKQERISSLKARIYDYMYYGEARTRTSTVFEFNLPQLLLTKLLIRPKSRIKKMRNFFIKEQPIFKELIEFHKKYEIRSANTEALAYELNEDFLDLLADQQTLWVEGGANYVLFYYKHKTIPVGELMECYAFILDLLDRLVHGQSSEEYV